MCIVFLSYCLFFLSAFLHKVFLSFALLFFSFSARDSTTRSVCLSVSRSVGPSQFRRPTHPHATKVAVYPALFFLFPSFLLCLIFSLHSISILFALALYKSLSFGSGFLFSFPSLALRALYVFLVLFCQTFFPVFMFTCQKQRARDLEIIYHNCLSGVWKKWYPLREKVSLHLCSFELAGSFVCLFDAYNVIVEFR